MPFEKCESCRGTSVMIKPIFLVIILTCTLLRANANPCQKNQGALDFGSGTTKALVVSVDTCEKKILEVLYEERIPLALNEALEKSSTHEIPFAIVEKEMPRLQNILNKMRTDLKVEKVLAVATSVFRVAKNGASVAKELSQKLKITIEIVSQEREAELGYWSVLAQKKISSGLAIIVWDIGGGSMQMYAYGPHEKVNIYQGNLASVTFKNKILEILQFKNPKEYSSPNPIGNQRLAALQLAKNHAYLNVPVFFKKNATKRQWFGVGGVLSMSVQKQVKKGAMEFTQEELTETLKKRSYLKDSEIDSDYRATDISNLALVLGYMQALNIPKINTVQASLGEGILFYSLNHGR